jgi:hypothetical protein
VVTGSDPKVNKVSECLKVNLKVVLCGEPNHKTYCVVLYPIMLPLMHDSVIQFLGEINFSFAFMCCEWR